MVENLPRFSLKSRLICFSKNFFLDNGGIMSLGTTKRIEFIVYPKTWLEIKIEKLFSSWTRSTSLLPLFLFFANLGTYAFSGFPEKLDESFWKELFQLPLLTLYILLAWPLIKKKHEKAIQIFKPLMVRGDFDFQNLLTSSVLKSRRLELPVMFISIVFGYLVFKPWNQSWMWWPYLFLAQFIMFGLFGWFVYICLTSSQIFSVIGRQPINFNIFLPVVLEPVAKWSLGVSTAFIGLATIGALFMKTSVFSDFRFGTFYVLTLCVSVIIFFLGTWDAHKMIITVKEREIERINQMLKKNYDEFHKAVEKGNLQEIETLSELINTLLGLEKRLQEAPEWPYSADVVRNLALSIIFPCVLAYMESFLN